jgi:hypothetical protein
VKSLAQPGSKLQHWTMSRSVRSFHVFVTAYMFLTASRFCLRVQHQTQMRVCACFVHVRVTLNVFPSTGSVMMFEKSIRAIKLVFARVSFMIHASLIENKRTHPLATHCTFPSYLTSSSFPRWIHIIYITSNHCFGWGCSNSNWSWSQEGLYIMYSWVRSNGDVFMYVHIHASPWCVTVRCARRSNKFVEAGKFCVGGVVAPGV